MSDIQQAVTGLATAFEQFKAANDERLKQIETKGKADTLTEEKVDKINSEVSRLQEKMEKISVALQRPAAAAQAEQKDGLMDRYLRKGEIALEGKALTVGSDPNGGYLVSPEMSSDIVKRVYDLSPIRRIAKVVPINSESLDILVDNGDITASWIGETASRSETTNPQLGRARIATHELYAEPAASQKLLEDAAINVEAWLAGKVADSFARAEASAFIGGSGVDRPYGFTSYTAVATSDASRTWNNLEYVVSGASGAFDSTTPGDRIFNIIYALKAFYRQNAVFVMPKAVALLVRKFKESTTNAYIWQPGLAAGQPQTLAGYPIVEAEDMPALAANSYSLAFGDFREGYTIVDRIGIQTLRDPYSSSTGLIKFKTRMRVGGSVVNFDAIKLMKFGTS